MEYLTPEIMTQIEVLPMSEVVGDVIQPGDNLALQPEENPQDSPSP